VHRGRWVNLTFVLGVGDDDHLITIAAGKITEIRQRHLPTDTGSFSIRASKESWAKHWQAVPPRDYHDIFAMLPKGIATIDGDLIAPDAEFAIFQRYHCQCAAIKETKMAVEFEPMIGRYFTLKLAADPTGFIWKKQEVVFHCYVFTPPDQMRGNFGIFCQIRTSPVAFE